LNSLSANFKVIESRHKFVYNLFKQLLAIGLEEFLKTFFKRVLFFAFFINNMSFTAVVNGRDRSVGDVAMFSSISGSESADVENL
jgi:hypothetical protein